MTQPFSFEPVRIGARSWNHQDWVGSFFPDDLPVEWRLSYYANEFSTVLVPVELWQETCLESLDQWREDVYENFRFVLEFSRAGALTKPEDTMERLRRLDGLVTGILLPSVPEDPWRNQVVETVGAHVRFCVLLNPKIPVASLEWFLATGGEICWTPGTSAAAGAYSIGLIHPASVRLDLRNLRHLLEAFLNDTQGAGVRYLFFAGDPPEVSILRDALTMAGLLGVL